MRGPAVGVWLFIAALSACNGRPEPLPAGTPFPVPRTGTDVIGTNIETAMPQRWVGDPVPVSGPDAAPLTLVRFWTDTCPFCEASLPAIERLRNRYSSQGLATVAIYHPKPPRRIKDTEDVELAARERKYSGPVAIDEYWAALKTMWLDAAPRPATSVTFLVDDTGTIRYVHPGPEFYPADHGEDAGANADYEDLETAIRMLLVGES